MFYTRIYLALNVLAVAVLSTAWGIAWMLGIEVQPWIPLADFIGIKNGWWEFVLAVCALWSAIILIATKPASQPLRLLTDKGRERFIGLAQRFTSQLNVNLVKLINRL